MLLKSHHHFECKLLGPRFGWTCTDATVLFDFSTEQSQQVLFLNNSNIFSFCVCICSSFLSASEKAGSTQSIMKK